MFNLIDAQQSTLQEISYKNTTIYNFKTFIFVQNFKNIPPQQLFDSIKQVYILKDE